MSFNLTLGRRSVLAAPAALVLMPSARAQQDASPADVAAIAKEAWIYADAMMMSHG
jgi:hypothetical protein